MYPGLGAGLATGFAAGLAVFLTALAVKALDDLLDEPEGRGGRAGGVAAYVAVLLVVAAGLDRRVAVSLFLAAYAVGMVSSPLTRLPSGLPSWGESLVAVGLGACLTGALEVLGSVLVVTAVQVFDDFWDLARDREAGRVGVAAAIGRWPALALAVLLYIAAALISPVKTLPTLAAVGVLVVPEGGRRRGEGRNPGLPRFAIWGLGAAFLGAVGEASGGGGAALLDPAGLALGGNPAEWGLLAAGCLLVVAVAGGLVKAYSRGHDEGRRRGIEVGKALTLLQLRADHLDEAETGAAIPAQRPGPRPGLSGPPFAEGG